MKIAAREVLAFVGECTDAGRAVDADRLCRRFPQLTRRAAALQLTRLAGYGLIAPTSTIGPAWSRRYTVTIRGRGRIAWHHGAAVPRTAAGGLIEWR